MTSGFRGKVGMSRRKRGCQRKRPTNKNYLINNLSLLEASNIQFLLSILITCSVNSWISWCSIKFSQIIRKKMIGRWMVELTLQLPWVTKSEFLLTISIQYQADKWWEYRKMSVWELWVDPIPNSPNWHQKNCMGEVKRIIYKILGVKGLMITTVKCLSQVCHVISLNKK